MQPLVYLSLRLVHQQKTHSNFWCLLTHQFKLLQERDETRAAVWVQRHQGKDKQKTPSPFPASFLCGKLLTLFIKITNAFIPQFVWLCSKQINEVTALTYSVYVFFDNWLCVPLYGKSNSPWFSEARRVTVTLLCTKTTYEGGRVYTTSVTSVL